MQKYKSLVFAVAAGVACSTAAAQEQAGESYRGSWNISGESISFDPDIAAYNGIADSGLGLAVGYTGEKGLFNFTLGASFFYIDDKEEFSQRVENDWTGDESTEDSSIDAGSLYLDAGIQYPLGRSSSFLVGLNAGYRYFDIDRGISNCRDCYSENITIESDSYLKPFARFDFTDSVTGALAYYRYTGDKGADSSLQFGVDVRF